MKDMDTFDRYLTASLGGADELPADFTSRVMERVRRTPQDSPRRISLTRRAVAWTAGLVACCAVVLLALPYLPTKDAKAESADFMAPESIMESGIMEDGVDENAADNTLTAAGVPESKTTYDNTLDPESGAVYYAADDETVMLRLWLDEQGISAADTEEGRLGYLLTAKETQALRTALPELRVWEQTLPDDQMLTLWLTENGQ